MRLKWIGTIGLMLALAGSSGRALAAESPLIGAIKQGDAVRVRALLQQHADANAKDLDGTTALHWAVQRDQLETVGLLLTGGASATATNRYGITPLLAACEIGNVEVIDKLLRAGADANGATPAGETALMIAARTGKVAAVKRLVAAGADVNAKEAVRGQTALMWAAAEDNLEATTMLLEAGANVNARTPAGFTALHFAVRGGNTGVVKALAAHGANVNDAIQPTAVPRPAAPMRTNAAAAPPAPGAAAAPGGSAPATGTPAPGGTPTASAYGQRPAAAGTNTGVAQLLQVFNTGSRGGRGGIGGTSPLVLAITNAHFELASTLLDLGADPNADGQGWTPLHQLAWTRRPPVQHGLPPAVPTGNITSLELAEKLLQYGADPDIRMTREPSDGARNILNRIGSTPFLQAAKLADIPFMKLLLEYGADASIPTSEGATPLMAAAGVGIWQVGENAGTNEEAFEAVKICYEAGNRVDTADANGDTALHGAAHRGSNEMVAFLVEKGAKLDVVNTIGWSPFTIAHGVLYPNTFNRHLDTEELLVKLGANPRVGKPRPEDLAPNDEGSISTTGKR
jgi:ankyrin repeat protein